MASRRKESPIEMLESLEIDLKAFIMKEIKDEDKAKEKEKKNKLFVIVSSIKEIIKKVKLLENTITSQNKTNQESQNNQNNQNNTKIINLNEKTEYTNINQNKNVDPFLKTSNSFIENLHSKYDIISTKKFKSISKDKIISNPVNTNPNYNSSNLVTDQQQSFTFSKLDNALNNLKSQNLSLKDEISKLNTTLIDYKDKLSCSYKENQTLLRDSKLKEQTLLDQARKSEENFNKLVSKYELLLNENKDAIKEMNKNSHKNSEVSQNIKEKNIIIPINHNNLNQIQDLKNKILSYEESNKRYIEEIKNLMKKNNKLNSTIDELTKNNQELLIKINKKEERLKDIRVINTNLEKKSNYLIKKFDSIYKIEQKTTQLTMENNAVNDNLKEREKELMNQMKNNQNLTEQYNDLANNYKELERKYNLLKDENNLLKKSNKQLVTKYQEMEQIFKRQIENDASSSNIKNINAEEGAYYGSEGEDNYSSDLENMQRMCYTNTNSYYHNEKVENDILYNSRNNNNNMTSNSVNLNIGNNAKLKGILEYSNKKK